MVRHRLCFWKNWDLLDWLYAITWLAMVSFAAWECYISNNPKPHYHIVYGSLGIWLP